VLGSAGNCYLNNMSFGSETTVMEKFEELLKANGLSLNTLSIDTVYTFVMACKEFSLIPLKKDYLVLRSIFTLVKQTSPDPVNKLRDPRLKPYMVNLQDKTYKLVNSILRKKRSRWFNDHIDSDLPINYFVLYHERVY